MSQTTSDYIRSHDLVRKYGLGLAVIALAGIAGVLNGNTPSIITLKMMVAIPFAIAWTWLPGIFDPVRSRTPFTPSFIERTALEGLLLSLAITLANWTPDYSPPRMVVTATATAVVYFGLYSLAYTIIRKGRR